MPVHYELLATCPHTGARRGRLHTSHGTVETPCFMPVGTVGTVKTLQAEDVEALGYSLILANTYHLALRPGEEVVKELGGTGRTHDWATSRRIRDALHPRPVFLAGGLHADNVRQALTAVQPYGVDLCSKVRTDGRLDAAKLHAFMAAVSGQA